jgi:CO/xanthine dehydrogenase Mo-binding subunit
LIRFYSDLEIRVRNLFVIGGSALEELELVGKSPRRVDAVGKVTGKTLFGTDVKLAGMLHGKVLRSPLPHARIVHIDTSRAERLPGVRAVATGKDLEATYGACVKDQPYYCTDKVRFVGDPVAGVAAIDEEIASEALDLIRVEYEELPAVFDPIEAMSPGAPLIHEKLDEYWHGGAFFPVPGTNICNHFKLRKGDTDEGFRQADYISEETFRTQMVQHCHIEPHAALVQVDASGRILIWSNTQHPYSCVRELSRSLDIPMHKIRVMVTCLGGGFGGKALLKVEPVCLVLAMKVKNNRPVKITFTREEEFFAAVVRHPSVVTVKTGVRIDGTLTARTIQLVYDTGAYAEGGPTVTRNPGFSSNGPYFIPNMWVDSYCVYTNKTIGGAFRGLGIPQMMWAIDSQMDILAEKIGMDPVEFRLKNALEVGSVTATGQVLTTSVGIKDCIRKASEAIGWKDRKKVRGRGMGIGVMHKMTMTPAASSAFVKLNEDGTAEVQASTVDMGQGSNTVLAQIAAEELGLKMEDVRVVSPDTDVTPYDHGTSSSRSTFHMGNAVKAAAADARKQLLEIAADFLEANPEDLEVHQGVVSVKGSPERKISVRDIPKGGSYLGKGRPVLGRGIFTVTDATPLDRETGQGAMPAIFWMYAAQAAEVEVDEETGRVKVLRIASAHDVGKAINPEAVEQQIEGALGTGIGATMMEEIKFQGGKTLNGSFVDYKIPTSLNMPEMIPIMVETIHDKGPYGAKGMGEPALAPTAPAIANAVYDAVGVRIKELPVTPDKVLKALKAQREKG